VEVRLELFVRRLILAECSSVCTVDSWFKLGESPIKWNVLAVPKAGSGLAEWIQHLSDFGQGLADAGDFFQVSDSATSGQHVGAWAAWTPPECCVIPDPPSPGIDFEPVPDTGQPCN
jgi:hypothetical protein